MDGQLESGEGDGDVYMVDMQEELMPPKLREKWMRAVVERHREMRDRSGVAGSDADIEMSDNDNTNEQVVHPGRRQRQHTTALSGSLTHDLPVPPALDDLPAPNRGPITLR
ncbi:hypothetical protein NEOLEDRAFT_1182209 [Neolentinus lepideus HHB14362 ss-1]|uniref:Uncharacterized protein n=1 Tax=Neolentinus lepideus HHB14362 ss-1 TaxID=1314782 RepID=A0A165PDN9_9AGAM|nr:hypothetical protein NEOLEDRAFT_1182209 [Neolentinus lepideus HHB14362 ss-1]